MSVNKMGKDDIQPVLTVDELAGLLRLHRNKVYQMLQKGQVPGARRIGTVYRISRESVMRWLSDGDNHPKKAGRGSGSK